MNDLIFQLHSPEEFRYLSSLGHWIVGYIFVVISVIASSQAFGFLRSQKYLWPAVVVIAGFILLPYNFLHHGLEKVGLVWQVIQIDPQQRQHTTIFVMLFIGGIIELLLSISKLQGKLWHFVWPAALVISGIMLVFHPQHGTAEAIAFSAPYHQTLGTIVAFAGIFKGGEVRIEKKRRWFSFAWIVFLLAASILLITYNEPEGAYKIGGDIYDH